MRRDNVKVRDRALIRDLEAQVLDGNVLALRALIRQAAGPNTLELPFTDVHLRAQADGTGGTRLEFTGCFSTTEAPYEMADWAGPYTEVVREGFLAKTLGVPMGSWSTTPDVIFCLNHGWDAAPMGRTKADTVRLMEDSQGGQAFALLDGSRQDVYTVQSAMEAGELDAMSFAFWTTRQTWSPDYTQRDILEVDMDGGDVSVVTWPANPGTEGTTALRNAAGRALIRSNVPRLLIAHARAEHRAGKTLSAATVATLTEVLDLIAASDVGLDQAQPLLAELLGVPNPDEPDAAGALDNPDDGGDSNSQLASPPAGMSLSLMRLREDPAVRQAVPA